MFFLLVVRPILGNRNINLCYESWDMFWIFQKQTSRTISSAGLDRLRIVIRQVLRLIYSIPERSMAV